MDHFEYRRGELRCEGVPVARIADQVGTPAYVYSAATLLDHYDRVAAAFAALDPIICYSIKSCANVHVCRLLRERGSGFDVVSGGEIVRALRAGGDPAKIVFAGVGKSDDEINQAIDAKIGWFNIESEAELENLIALAGRRGAVVQAALRVNPDVDPRTHRYTSTGKKETKFGVDLERARRVFEQYGPRCPAASGHDASVPGPAEGGGVAGPPGGSAVAGPAGGGRATGPPGVRLCGIHLHIGSPVNSVDPYVQAITKGLALIEELRAAGFTIDTLDIGGGFGAHYRADEAPPAVAYADALVPLLAGRGLRIILEPGRSIAANAGILLTRTLYVKQSGDRRFLIVDAGMNDLIRPALYEAYHFIWPVRPPPGFVPASRGEGLDLPGAVAMDVVGPVCESGDFFAKDRPLPPMQRGDLVAVFSAGAYGMVMASHYNSRPNPPEVLVEGDTFRVIRRRETYDDLLAAETDEA